jgi:hypothetical protein
MRLTMIAHTLVKKRLWVGWVQVACDDKLWVRGCWAVQGLYRGVGWPHRGDAQSKAKRLGLGAWQLVRPPVVGRVRVAKGMEMVILSSSLFRIDHVC